MNELWILPLILALYFAFPCIIVQGEDALQIEEIELKMKLHLFSYFGIYISAFNTYILQIIIIDAGKLFLPLKIYLFYIFTYFKKLSAH